MGKIEVCLKCWKKEPDVMCDESGYYHDGCGGTVVIMTEKQYQSFVKELCPKCKKGHIIELTPRIRHCSNIRCGLVLEEGD